MPAERVAIGEDGVRRGLLNMVAALAAGLAVGAAAQAHHSAAQFDTTKDIEIEGVVTEFDWKNPHIYMTIETTGPDGAAVTQEIEAGSGSVLLPLGLTRRSVAAGEHVVIRANPNRAGPGHTVLGRTLTKDDGTVLPLYITERSVLAPNEELADSIAGRWFSPFSNFGALAGARRSWTLTEEAQDQIAAFDTKTDSTQAECIPIGAPALMVYPVLTAIDVGEDTVTIDVDWMGAERVVHLDQAEHPADLEPSLHGHSIGHWEGDTLVVDTIGFTPHREGFGFGMPSSAGKHLVERFSLSEDRRRLVYEVTAEDPEYIVGLGEARAELEYRPDLQPTGVPCDLEIAQRFLREE